MESYKSIVKKLMKFPISNIIFETAKDCNLSCLYCYNHWKVHENSFKDATDKIRWKTLKTIIKKIDFQRITFTGGEPFLTRDLLEHLLHCRMKRKSVNVISNGNIGSYEQYGIINDLGVSLIQFPLLSDKESVHDELTGKIGSFRKVVDSIKFFNYSQTEVCAVFVLTRKNVNYLKSTIKYAEELGVEKFMLARFNIGGSGISNIKKLLVSSKELNDSFHLADDLATKTRMQISANVCVPYCIINPADFKKLYISSCGSDFKKRPITIDAFGDVRLCNHSPKSIGNIHNNSLDRMFNSDYVKSWEDICPQYCDGCNHWEQCRGGCRAASEQLGLGLINEDPIIHSMKNVDSIPFI